MKRVFFFECAWPGREPFYFGNVVIDARAKDHEVREFAIREALAALTRILPVDCAPPEIRAVIPGGLFIHDIAAMEAA